MRQLLIKRELCIVHLRFFYARGAEVAIRFLDSVKKSLYIKDRASLFPNDGIEFNAKMWMYPHFVVLLFLIFLHNLKFFVIRDLRRDL